MGEKYQNHTSILILIPILMILMILMWAFFFQQMLMLMAWLMVFPYFLMEISWKTRLHRSRWLGRRRRQGGRAFGVHVCLAVKVMGIFPEFQNGHQKYLMDNDYNNR